MLLTQLSKEGILPVGLAGKIDPAGRSWVRGGGVLNAAGGGKEKEEEGATKIRLEIQKICY